MFFYGKVVISGFGCRHGDLAVKRKCGRTKFVQFVL